MEIVPIEVFGVSVDVAFPAPLGLAQAKLDEFGAKLCDQKEGLRLRPELIRLRRVDDLFDYELKANFFGENGFLTRTAERIKFGIRNARTGGDWQIIRDSLTRLYTIMDFAPATTSALSCYVHAKFDSPEHREGWLEQFSQGFDVVRPAGLGYVRIPDWEKEIRLLIEGSNVVPNGVFIAWDTQFTNNQDWDTFLGSLPTVMENSANLMEIGFEPLR